MNSAPNVEVCTAVWSFDDYVVVVDPTTEKPSDLSTSDLDMTMVGIHKHMDSKLIK